MLSIAIHRMLNCKTQLGQLTEHFTTQMLYTLHMVVLLIIYFFDDLKPAKLLRVLQWVLSEQQQKMAALFSVLEGWLCFKGVDLLP